MDQAYWIIEYVKLLLAYGFVLFVWPSVVFRPHLKGKGATYRFAFCTTVMVLLVTTCVLMMGLIHILTPWMTILLFYGVFVVQLWRNYQWDMTWIRNLRNVSAGTMSLKQLIFRIFRWIGRRIRQGFELIAENTRGRRLEFLLLLVLVIFGMIYFSYGAFDEHVYGSGDQYVHHAWTYGLKQGMSFSSGIYPEGMHCMIYLTTVCFGLRLYTGILFFGGIQSAILLVSIWIFLREVFRWRYVALIVLAMFLTFDQNCVSAVLSMSRISWTLPMEYALYSVFLAGTFLLRFCRRACHGERLRLPWKHPLKVISSLFMDKDLLILMMAIAVSLAVHFYATMLAAFFCIGVAIVFWRSILRRGVFGSLFISVLLAFLMAVLPMGAAYVMGYPLQGSLTWAISVIEGDKKETESSSDDRQSDIEAASGSSDAESITPADGSGAESISSAGVSGEGTGSAADSSGAESISSADTSGTQVQEKSAGTTAKILDLLRRIPGALFKDGYRSLYNETRARLIVAATIFTLISALLLHFLLLLLAKGKLPFSQRKPRTAEENREDEAEAKPAPEITAFDGHLAAAIISLIVMFVYAAPALGLPTLIERPRLYNTEQVLCLAMYAVPLDYLLTGMSKLLPRLPLRQLSAVLVPGVYVLAQALGIFHGHLYCQMTRYSAAVSMTNKIIEEIPRNQFTIVSTTDELYQLIEYGYHEEVLTFVNQSKDPKYTLPTPYVFVFVEKHPLKYAHYHFPAGSPWLASEKYAGFFNGFASQCPEMFGGEISPEDAAKDVKYGAKLSDSATDLEGRTILESKLYYNWYEKFSKMYPNETRVVYEDDNFLCVCFVQNPACLFTLGGIESRK